MEALIKIAVMIYNGVELVDMNGPIDVFVKANRYNNNKYQIYTVAATSDPIISEVGILTVTPEFGRDSSETTTSCCCNDTQLPKVEGTLMTIKKTSASLPSILTSVLIAFFPKCPLCWAVYMSTFGSLGLVQLPYMPLLLPVLIACFALHLFMLCRKIPQKGYLPFLVSLAGAIVILACRIYLPNEKWLLVTGMAFIVSGSLLNSFSGKIQFQLFNLKQQPKQPLL